MNIQLLSTSLRIAGWLLWCDVQLFMKDWWNNAQNSFVWPLVLILSNGYVLPAMGMPADYGPFIAINMLTMMAFWTAWTSASVYAADFEATRSINYELTLPLPYWMVYIRIVLHFAIKGALFNLLSLLIGKVVLMNTFSFSNFSILKFVLAYGLASIFFGAFSLWAASFAGSIDKFMNMELRVVGPLLFICGYSFSWATLYSVSPVLAYLMLVSPFIYAYEGVREAILGQAGTLDYWHCIGMLVVATILFGAHGLWLFKRRLDCV
jgi:ABC-type multidrug transport system permease subunit